MSVLPTCMVGWPVKTWAVSVAHITQYLDVLNSWTVLGCGSRRFLVGQGDELGWGAQGRTLNQRGLKRLNGCWMDMWWMCMCEHNNLCLWSCVKKSQKLSTAAIISGLGLWACHKVQKNVQNVTVHDYCRLDLQNYGRVLLCPWTYLIIMQVLCMYYVPIWYIV